MVDLGEFSIAQGFFGRGGEVAGIQLDGEGKGDGVVA